MSNMYETGISSLEARGYMESTKYYSALQDVTRDSISIMESELDDLSQALQDALDSGEIEKYSESWYEMQIAINDVAESIAEANVQLQEYAKTMREIEWSYFDYGEDLISQITQETDFLIDLLSNENLYQDNGQFNENGLAVLGLRTQNYDVYMAQADQYAEEIKKLNEEIADDPYNTDLISRRNDLLKLQQEMILAAEDEKNAIISLVEDGINIEIDAFKELATSYQDALDSCKD